MASIKCLNGPEHRHESVEESRQCWAATSPSNASAPVGVTNPPPAPPAAVPHAMQHRTTVPLAMLETTPDGYYAVRQDAKDHFRFLRISRRFGKKSKWLGCIQIQTQHSEMLKPLMLYRPLNSENAIRKDEWLWVAQPNMQPYLILAIVDPMGAGQAYASELGRCMICGKTLTDPRSIHYGIGPDCEKDHPEVIAYVDGQEAEENE